MVNFAFNWWLLCNYIPLFLSRQSFDVLHDPANLECQDVGKKTSQIWFQSKRWLKVSGPIIQQHGTDILIYSPGKLTCPLKINGWKIYFLLKSSLFRGHFSFRGFIFPKEKCIHPPHIHTWTLDHPMGLVRILWASTRRFWPARSGQTDGWVGC